MYFTDRRLITVLVAEDNSDAREILTEILQVHGYNVVQAANGVEALQTVQDGLIHIVLTDMRMPLMSGLDFAMVVREIPELAHIPFALLSATPLPDSWAALNVFSALLVKPCPMEKLLATIDRLAGAI